MAFDSGGIFSSRSQSSAITTTQNAGFSEVGGAAVSLNLTGGGKKSNQQTTVNMLDAGAIQGAFGLGDRALGFAGDLAERALRSVELAGTNAKGTVSEAVKAVSESARSETENILLGGTKWVVIAVIAVAGFYALGKMRG